MQNWGGMTTVLQKVLPICYTRQTLHGGCVQGLYCAIQKKALQGITTVIRLPDYPPQWVPKTHT